MRKILMRAHMSPFCDPDFMELSNHDLIGSNIGNLLFAGSVCRTIMTEDTQIDCIKINKNFSNEEIERFNNEYECFIIPLANAFRPDFIKELNRLSELIEKLKISCVVVGVGTQGNLTDEKVGGYPYDEDVRRFVNCVLDKSALLGLRGERTAQYLETLGYKSEKDFTIIGCPSMYLHGGSLPEFQKKEITPNSAIVFSCSLSNPPQLQSFMGRNFQLLKNYHYVPQTLDEMNAMYLGKPLPENRYPNLPDYYPSSFDSPIYTNGYGIGFLNLNTWLEFLSKQDFSFGPKIHGNIAAIVSGTPCYVIAPDVRVEELCRYHYIPYTPYTELNEDESIFDLYDKADYGPMFAHHLNNFHHYLDFLNVNGVQHIYQESDVVEDCPFDKKMKEIDFNGPIRAFSDVSSEEQAKRLKQYYDYLDEQRNKLRENIQRLEKDKKADQKKFQEKIRNLEITEENQSKEIYSLKNTVDNQKKEIQNFETKAKNRENEIQRLTKKTKNQRKKIRSLEKTNENQNKELEHRSVQMVINARKNIEKTGIYKKLKGNK